MGEEVVAFGEAGSFGSGGPEMRDGGEAVAGEFEEMSANGVETMMNGEARVGIEGVEQLQTLGGTVNHGGGDGVI